jgi:D-lactate dehydrogenase
MTKVKIAVFDAKAYDQEFFDKENQDFSYEIKYFSPKLNIDTVTLADGFDVVCLFVNDDGSETVLNKLNELGIKLIALRSAGYNNIDLQTAYEKINVVRVPAYSPHAVAEHTVALMLTLNRKTHKAYYRIRENNFSINGLMGFDMNEKTAGIIGTGKIGKALIEILKGFKMNVIAYDKYPDEEYAKEIGYNYVELETLYKESDIISLNAPLTSETFHMINEESFSKMKNNVMLVNTGRGKLIDTKALISALKNKQVGSAALDVYEEESEYFFEDFSGSFLDDDTLARLITFNNVLITSHQGFFTREAVTSIARTTLSNIKEFMEDKPLSNEICYHCDGDTCPKRDEKKKRCF